MGIVCKCLFRFCCDVEEEEHRMTESGAPYADEPTLSSSSSSTTTSILRGISTTRSMSRGNLFESQQSYQIAPQGSQDEDDDEEGANMDGTSNNIRAELLVVRRRNQHSGTATSTSCRNAEEEVANAASTTGSAGTATPLTIHDFFRKLRDRWRMYDALEASTTATTTADLSSSPSLKDGDAFRKNLYPRPTRMSPLRQASSFDASKDIPVILPEEVVLPGSELQKEMARVMSKTLEGHDDECVICMEGFDPTNPRMPTVCGCGENKTYFHLPCLYQWIEQSPDCPSCRQRLRWEEF